MWIQCCNYEGGLWGNRFTHGTKKRRGPSLSDRVPGDGAGYRGTRNSATAGQAESTKDSTGSMAGEKSLQETGTPVTDRPSQSLLQGSTGWQVFPPETH